MLVEEVQSCAQRHDEEGDEDVAQRHDGVAAVGQKPFHEAHDGGEEEDVRHIDEHRGCREARMWARPSVAKGEVGQGRHAYDGGEDVGRL